MSESKPKRNIREILQLGKLERLVMEYFIRHISAGDIVAVLDLKEEVKRRMKMGEIDLASELEDAIIIRELYVKLALLVKDGFLEYKNGAYRLAQWVVDIIKAKKGGLYPGTPKNLEELID